MLPVCTRAPSSSKTTLATIDSLNYNIVFKDFASSYVKFISTKAFVPSQRFSRFLRQLNVLQISGDFAERASIPCRDYNLCTNLVLCCRSPRSPISEGKAEQDKKAACMLVHRRRLSLAEKEILRTYGNHQHPL